MHRRLCLLLLPFSPSSPAGAAWRTGSFSGRTAAPSTPPGRPGGVTVGRAGRSSAGGPLPAAAGREPAAFVPQFHRPDSRADQWARPWPDRGAISVERGRTTRLRRVRRAARGCLRGARRAGVLTTPVAGRRRRRPIFCHGSSLGTAGPLAGRPRRPGGGLVLKNRRPCGRSSSAHYGWWNCGDWLAPSPAVRPTCSVAKRPAGDGPAVS